VRDDGFRFREISGSVGSSSVDIDGLLTARRGLGGTRFDFKVAGPALQEMINGVGDFEVRHGPYELSGSIRLQPDMIRLRDFELERPFGGLKADLDLGLPVSRKWMDFDVQGRGKDVRSVLQGFESFEAYEQPFSLDIHTYIGETSILAEGDLAFTDAQATTEFQIDLTVPDLATLGTFDGRGFNHQPFSLSAHVDGRDGDLTVDQLVAKLGESDIGGFMQLRNGEVPDFEIDVFSDSVVFAPLLEEEEFEYDPEPKFDDGRLIPDIPIPFDAMKMINVSIDVDIGELQRDTLYMKDIVFDAVLRDGTLEISNSGFKARRFSLRRNSSQSGNQGPQPLSWSRANSHLARRRRTWIWR